MRREAQLIIPGLWLGPFQSSTDLRRMHSMGITHVLCIRDKREAALIYPRFPTEFRYMTIEISDTADQKLINILSDSKAFIDEALSSGGTVLAHCNGGISLSPAIVIGYLMTISKATWEDALAYVQSRRYCVAPSSFQIQLQEYEPIVRATQKILPGTSLGNGERKRSMSLDDQEEDTDDRARIAPSLRREGSDMDME
ncbi:phosphatases II [Naematelia encephala]|uniref:Phosphatases II n=1 Tax=Naematelia encephala TaxID=71784 RepID=A0A1Y2BHM2_9TREE|nr:phosphatases II [Naematelia encephala]